MRGPSRLPALRPSGQSPSTSAPAPGDWAIVNSADTSSAQDNLLFGVTCVSASDCWAAGYSLIGSIYQTLIERWDGTSWAIVSSPNTSASVDNFLLGVTCVAASNCWAVGYSYPGSAYQTLIERWDGTSWAIVTSPNNNPSATTCVTNGQPPGCTQYNLLTGVTCVATSDCWAVGWYCVDTGNVVATGCAYQTLVERWDGTSWAIVSSPNTGATQKNILTGVTCVSASDCWAAGYSVTGSTYQTLIERWDGTSWAIVSSPNTSATQDNVLFGVTCVQASDCRAVGYYAPGSWQTLTERWDGTSWAVVSSPDTSAAQGNVLYGVTCVSASECWAVGYYDAGGALHWQTLIEQWDGTSWAIAGSPDSGGTQYNVLSAVTCVSASKCWSVGYDVSPGNIGQTLIEEYTASPPPQVPEVPWTPFLPVAGLAAIAIRRRWAGNGTGGSG